MPSVVHEKEPIKTEKNEAMSDVNLCSIYGRRASVTRSPMLLGLLI